jgi:WAS family protein 1
MISYDPKNEDVLLSETTMIRTDPSKEGLGRLPEHLPSVSSLLLFNTQENPYKKYVSLDNLIGREVHKREEQVKKGLGEAPKTFTEGDHLPGVGGLEYNYKPVLGAIPEFNLPSALPLPNIAELNYSSDLASIAPSHSNAELPSVDLNPSMNGNVLTSPVPPSPAPIPSVQSTSLSISTPSLPPVTSAPPPPPSLPPVTSTPPPPPPSSQAIEPPTPSSAIDEPASSDRSDLLAQIRSGTKLRSVSARKLDAKPKKNAKAESAKPKGSGDIYTDLMQALKRRRVGIADKQQEKSKTREEEDFGAPPDDEWK